MKRQDARRMMLTHCGLAQQRPSLATLGAQILESGGAYEVRINDLIREVAAERGVKVVDLYGAMQPEDWIGGTDCFNPSQSGQDRIAAAFLEAIG